MPRRRDRSVRPRAGSARAQSGPRAELTHELHGGSRGRNVIAGEDGLRQELRRQPGSEQHATCDGVLHHEANAGSEEDLEAVELTIACIDADCMSSAPTLRRARTRVQQPGADGRKDGTDDKQRLDTARLGRDGASDAREDDETEQKGQDAQPALDGRISAHSLMPGSDEPEFANATSLEHDRKAARSVGLARRCWRTSTAWVSKYESVREGVRELAKISCALATLRAHR